MDLDIFVDILMELIMLRSLQTEQLKSPLHEISGITDIELV